MLLDEARLTADAEAHGCFIAESKFKDAGKGLFASRRKAFYADIPPPTFFFFFTLNAFTSKMPFHLALQISF